MSKVRILVVDDDPRLLRFVRANLDSVGYQVLLASDGPQALELMEREEPDIVILDIMLPGMDGFEVCRRIRGFSEVPIMMLTAKGEEADKVKGLELGADDYLTKPFGVQELIARVEALLRRTKFAEEAKPRPRFQSGDLVMDFTMRKVMVKGRELPLTPTEYKLLSQLAANAGRVMLHEELLAKVWGPEYRGELEYLRAYVRFLRLKIEEDPSNPKYILSRPGVGYLIAQLPEA